MRLWPIYVIFLVSGLLGIVLLLLPVRGTWRWIRGGKKKKKDGEEESAPAERPGRPGVLASVGEVLVGLLLLAIACTCVSLLGMLASFRAFNEKALVATLTAEPVAPQTIRFRYTPVVSDVPGETKEYVLRGDEWRVEGHILLWSGWTRMLGLRTCYRITRITGRFDSADEEREKRKTVIDLGGEEAPTWRFLKAQAHRLPGVESAYGGGAGLPPRTGAAFELYVLPGSFMVKRK